MTGVVVNARLEVSGRRIEGVKRRSVCWRQRRLDVEGEWMALREGFELGCVGSRIRPVEKRGQVIAIRNLQVVLDDVARSETSCEYRAREIFVVPVLEDKGH